MMSYVGKTCLEIVLMWIVVPFIVIFACNQLFIAVHLGSVVIPYSFRLFLALGLLVLAFRLAHK